MLELSCHPRPPCLMLMPKTRTKFCKSQFISYQWSDHWLSIKFSATRILINSEWIPEKSLIRDIDLDGEHCDKIFCPKKSVMPLTPNSHDQVFCTIFLHQSHERLRKFTTHYCRHLQTILLRSHVRMKISV